MREVEIELTNLEILNSISVLGGVQENGRQQIIGINQRGIEDVIVGFALGMNYDALAAHVDGPYQKYKTEILKRHADLDEAGELIINQENGELQWPDPKDRFAASKDIAVLNTAKVTLKLTKFLLQELKDAGVRGASPEALRFLKWMIEVPPKVVTPVETGTAPTPKAKRGKG